MRITASIIFAVILIITVLAIHSIYYVKNTYETSNYVFVSPKNDDKERKVLPSALVIGMAKAGTDTLMEMISMHSKVKLRKSILSL